MHRWMGVAVAGVLMAAAAGGVEKPLRFFQPGAPSAAVATPSRAELVVQLAHKEAELHKLKARLEQLDEERWVSEARGLGILAVLEQAGFTDKQQQRLAVAIVKQARKSGLDPLLVLAVIRCESSFNPYAKSGPGAMGLMQVMPETGRWLAAQRGFDLKRTSNLFDPDINIELGTAYLAQLIQKFGSVENALIAYNAGPVTAKKILAQSAAFKKFVAGYPRRVLAEMTRLKSRQDRSWADRVAAERPGTAG